MVSTKLSRLKRMCSECAICVHTFPFFALQFCHKEESGSRGWNMKFRRKKQSLPQLELNVLPDGSFLQRLLAPMSS